MKAPDDFPWDRTPPSLSGSQPKLAGRLIDGKFVVGQTAAERDERWDMCEDLAQQLVPKTLQDAEKNPENTRDATLRRIRRALVRKDWLSTAELDWLMQRLRVLLGW